MRLIFVTLEEQLDTIKERCGKLLFLYPELKQAHPNIRLFAYWKFFDSFGEITLDPSIITNYHSIDRAFRYLIPQEFKNMEAEGVYRKKYVSQKEDVC